MSSTQSWRTLRALGVLGVCSFLFSAAMRAQISLASAVDLSYKTDPRVQSAAADVQHARAALSESKDTFVPVVMATGGTGRSAGAPLGVPTVFTITAQSLVFNWSQADYIRSAHFGWDAAQLALQQAQLDTAEDVASTYLALDNAQQRRAAAQSAVDHARSLLTIVQDRVSSGQDAHIEIPRTDLTLTQMEQQLAHIDAEIATLSYHLQSATGLTGAQLHALHNSVPPLPETSALTANTTTPVPLPAGIQAAFMTARSKFEQAQGDTRYLYRPQISFAANYSRITTDFTNYSVYYPAFADPSLSHNALSFGVEIQLPLLDQAHRAKARASAADARKAMFDAEEQKNTFLEGKLKLQRAVSDLEFNTRIAQDQADIAQDELSAVLAQLGPHAAALGSNEQAVTPKDEQRARLQIAQRQLDLLNAQLQLAQNKITLMRQNGTLAAWIHSVPAASSIQP